MNAAILNAVVANAASLTPAPRDPTRVRDEFVRLADGSAVRVVYYAPKSAAQAPAQAAPPKVRKAKAAPAQAAPTPTPAPTSRLALLPPEVLATLTPEQIAALR